MSPRAPLRECQIRLFVLWAALSILALVMILIQISPGGVYAARAGAVFDWFLPAVLPTISLMIGTLVADKRNDPTATVDRFTYRLALWLSVLYLVLVIAVLLAFAQSATPLDGLKSSAKLLSGVNGLVGLALGALFVSQARGA